MPCTRTDRLQTPTIPVASPRWSLASWARCTEEEILIDLAEWAAANGCEPLTSYRCALTAELWTLVQNVPFSEVSTPLELRLRPLIRAARHALDRLLKSLPHGPVAPGASADFSFPLRRRSEHPAGCHLRIHAEESEGHLFVTLGMCGDFGTHPLAHR